MVARRWRVNHELAYTSFHFGKTSNSLQASPSELPEFTSKSDEDEDPAHDGRGRQGQGGHRARAGAVAFTASPPPAPARTGPAVYGVSSPTIPKIFTLELDTP